MSVLALLQVGGQGLRGSTVSPFNNRCARTTDNMGASVSAHHQSTSKAQSCSHHRSLSGPKLGHLVCVATPQLLAAESRLPLPLQHLLALWVSGLIYLTVTLLCLQCPQECSEGRPGAARQAQQPSSESTAWPGCGMPMLPLDQALTQLHQDPHWQRHRPCCVTKLASMWCHAAGQWRVRGCTNNNGSRRVILDCF